MDSINSLLGWVNILAGIVYIALAVPMLRGSVKMNYIYGARFAESFKSEESWQAINKYSAKWLMSAGAILVVVGLLAFFVPLDEGGILIWLVSLAAAIAAFVVLIASYRYARNFAAQK